MTTGSGVGETECDPRGVLETVFLPSVSDDSIASCTQEQWAAAEVTLKVYKVLASSFCSVKVTKVKERPRDCFRLKRIEA